ncbi:uncharacterized protein ms(2)34Fe [Drosophila virilis]|uniref:Uncharacterized protein n=1 Tax=Drosophila virilis TaxID=7244 RepID=B4M8R7_DROVI|nr:uncharacterized protein LOC6634132 [Drosophila virilis]EDW57593.1 uncharacterized protein Dvir_GJ18177 [Drosophila virilis]
MSTLSTRRTDFSSRRSTRKSQGGPPAITYDIYCVNFYDNGLKAVREEFIKQIKLGLRRFLFVIDLDTELEDARVSNQLSSRLSSKFKKDVLPTNPLDLTLLRIHDCLAEYDLVTRQIEAELSFNMLKYYQKNVPAQLKIRSVDSKKEKSSGMESKRRPISKTKDTTDTKSLGKISCFGVNAKEHHRVGKGYPLSKRLYIKDAPLNTTILILIMGRMDNDFYMQLLGNAQPLRGVVHFLPEECAYDLLVPRPRREKQLRETIEKIQRDIYALRKRALTKPVGIFQQQLPQMSKCQSVKYSSEIFDQLSYYMYDMQMLREQYDEYYVKPYHEINVKMRADTSLQDSLQMAESLSIQGHYLRAEMPAVHDDDASIYLYMESLMCTFGNPRDLMSEMEVLLLANPTSSVQTRVLDKIKVYANAFKSIIKLVKSERLFVEQANTLLCNIVSYMDQEAMRNIYHACLEYNVLRRYFTTGYIIEKIHPAPYNTDMEPQHLPKYAKLYLTDDSVSQRIIQLITEYDNYKVQEIYPKVKLYTFKRALNEVFEKQQQITIPTRLCFRDFTLYEMQQFLQDLVTPQMFETAIEVKHQETTSEYPSMYTLASDEEETKPFSCSSNRHYNITPSVFIRPKSLKAKRITEQQREHEKREKVSPRPSRLRSKESFRVSNKSMRSLNMRTPNNLKDGSDHEKPTFIGLGPDHAMLTGYNLDDARQTIKAKTSKYYFEEGLITLYEEKWNFRQMNKCLSIEIDKQTLHLTNEPGNIGIVAPNIRLRTPNGISLRVRPKDKECAKVVLNYPNGLSLYCHDNHAEHLWSGQQSKLNESRRINTPYGCVIVFYNNTDTVLIMRYNGEVYRLYSYVDVKGEEEGETEDNTSFINACSTQSTYSSYKPLPKRSLRKKRRPHITMSQTSRTIGGADTLGRKTASLTRDSSSISSQTLAARAAKAEARQIQMTQAAALFASIDPELKYLEFIMQLFNLSYKHLKLTTSLGSVVHVEEGKIHCGKPIRVTEWHDYFANESYAMRDDGMRMVWTHNSLRCYHGDGTVITSTIVDSWDRGIIEDEIDKQISSSSSHLSRLKPNEPESEETNVIYINVPAGSSLIDELYESKKYEKREPDKFDKKEPEYIEEIQIEDQYIYDYSFTTLQPNSFLIQHNSYAGTHFNFTHINQTDLELETKVIAADNLQFRIYQLAKDETVVQNESSYGDESPERRTSGDPISSEADADEWTRLTNINTLRSPTIIPKLPLIVDIEASNLQLSIREDRIELNAKLRKFGCDENVLVVRDNIQLNVNMMKSLSTVFSDWVDVFHKFINCACPKWRTAYFVESTLSDCRRKGLELFKTVPTLGNYNFCAGNYFIDPEELKTVNACMTSNIDWQKEDMVKFPRFPAKKKVPQIIQFPTVLSTKIFVEIPAQLAYTDRIHMFIFPFEKIKFRKLKHRFNEALIFHLYPHLRDLVHKEISNRSWRNLHIENKRRAFLEQQRLSLYVAMLKHKVYPNYFQFRDQYHSHVRYIDFFEFMASKCSEKNNPEHYQNVNDDDEPAISVKEQTKGKELKGRRKKCLCPRYEKSFK